MKDTSTILFRCHALGKIMTEPRTKAAKENGDLSETAKTHCIEVFAAWNYGRSEEAYSKYLDKGKDCEEQSITLLSLVRNKLYFKNDKRVNNDFITGEYDLCLKEGDAIVSVEDIKTSWDVFTYLKAVKSGLNTDHYWQLQGYMALTGAKMAHLNYCLVNATADLIDDEKRKLAYAMREIQGENNSPEFIERSKQIEKNMIYDMDDFKKRYPYYALDNDKWEYDIPMEDRVTSFKIERSDDDIAKMYERVKQCREWIKQNLL